MKLYDFDGMFDEKLSEYIKKNPGKHKEEEWEDLIPEMYSAFGDTFIKAVGDTPNGFYAKMNDGELVSALKTHIVKGVPVPAFLCNAIEKRNIPKLLLPLLDRSDEEVSYAINLLGASDAAIDKYFDILITAKDEDLKEKCLEMIKLKADLVWERAYKRYCDGKDKEIMLEIMSRVAIKDDRIFNALTSEFRSSYENLPMHASYLAAYGDERALKYLYDRIEEDISFVEFRELKYAIESLGGEYDKERDFSADPYYELIKSHNTSEDLFKAFDPANADPVDSDSADSD